MTEAPRSAGVTPPATARLPFVDAHLHLVDRGRLRYPWLDTPDNAPIAADYGIADYRREASAWNIAGAVHVDAGAHPDDGRAETAWLSDLADTHALPTAIVARVALNDPDMERQLDWHASHGRVRGIRHLVNWHPDPARCAYRRDLTGDAAWQRGYATLRQYGFSFDYHGFPPQLPALTDLAERHDAVPLVLNHLALPIVADGLDVWRAAIVRFAAMPHVSIKLSGAGFVRTPFDAAAFRDIVEEVIDRFGTHRVMVASNFPTDRLFASFDATLGAYETLLAGYPEDARRDLWGRNANRIYRLGLTL